MKRIVISVLAGSLLVGSQAFAFGIGGISVGVPGVGVSAASLGVGPAMNAAGSGAISVRGITVMPDGQIEVPAVTPRPEVNSSAAGNPSGSLQNAGTWDVCTVPEHCRY